MKYFLSFLLLLSFALQSKAQTPLTNAEVYNLSVGDVLYIVEEETSAVEGDFNYYAWRKSIKRTVLSKALYLPDSIVYSYLDSIAYKHYDYYYTLSEQYYVLNTMETVTHLSEAVAYQPLLPSSNILSPDALADLCTESDLYSPDTSHGYYNGTDLRTTLFFQLPEICDTCNTMGSCDVIYFVHNVENLGCFFDFSMSGGYFSIDSSRVLSGYERDGVLHGTTFSVVPTGVHTLYKPLSMQVQPNPTNDVLQILLPNQRVNAQIHITNLLGSTLKTVPLPPHYNQQYFSIATHDLPNGVYLVSYMADGKAVATAKVVVQR